MMLLFTISLILTVSQLGLFKHGAMQCGNLMNWQESRGFPFCYHNELCYRVHNL